MSVQTVPSGPPPAAPASEPVELSIVIVSYECRDHVLACLESLDRVGSSRRFEVIVVDNASSDGTVAAIEQRWPHVQVVAMDVNAGFARANNIGFARARGRFVLVLNPDTRVEPGALDELTAWLEAHPRAGVVAPRLVNVDGTDQRTARRFPTAAAALFGRRSPLTRWFPANPWSRRFLAGLDHIGDDPFTIDWVSGAAMMVPATAVSRTGGFDEAFFLFWEDADWCRRLADDGYQVWCVPRACIVHDEGATRSHGWSPRVAYHFHRGAYLYWRNHHAPQPWNPTRWLAAAGLAARAVSVMALDGLHRRRRAQPPSIPSVPSVTLPRSIPPVPQPSR